MVVIHGKGVAANRAAAGRAGEAFWVVPLPQSPHNLMEDEGLAGIALLQSLLGWAEARPRKTRGRHDLGSLSDLKCLLLLLSLLPSVPGLAIA